MKLKCIINLNRADEKKGWSPEPARSLSVRAVLSSTELSSYSQAVWICMQGRWKSFLDLCLPKTRYFRLKPESILLEAWQHFNWFWVSLCKVSEKSCLRANEMVKVLWGYVNSYIPWGLQKAPLSTCGFLLLLFWFYFTSLCFCRCKGHKWKFKTQFG